MKIFLDTNIILDMMEPKRPSYIASATLFDLARTKKIEMFVTTQSIVDSYYIGKKLSVPRAEMDNLMLWLLDNINVRCIDGFNMRDAILDKNPDIEDNAQVAMADDCGCDFFITNDRELIDKHSESLCTFLMPGQLVERLMQ